jgi:hypothetical protein
MKKKHQQIKTELTQLKRQVQGKLDKITEQSKSIAIVSKEKAVQKHEMKEREKTIRDKDKRIYELKVKNQELEKFKFVLDYKIKELKREIVPRE